MRPEKRHVLITGTSSGFGFLAAKTLLGDGHTVFATMRDPEGRNAAKAAALREAAASGPGALHVVALDVTDEADVERAIAFALRTAGHLDVLVNNAGVGCGSFLEPFTTDQVRALFDVNMFGVHRTCRAVLPHMRGRGQGLIINLSSAVGRYVLPFMGPYTATKFAIEGYSEGLAMELAPTGVEVAIVEPGGYMTELFQNMMQPGDPERLASYGELATMPEQMWAPFAEMLATDGPNPQLVADKIAALVAAPAGQRPLRSVVDPQTGAFVEALNAAVAKIQGDVMKALQGG